MCKSRRLSMQTFKFSEYSFDIIRFDGEVLEVFRPSSHYEDSRRLHITLLHDFKLVAHHKGYKLIGKAEHGFYWDDLLVDETFFDKASQLVADVQKAQAA